MKFERFPPPRKLGHVRIFFFEQESGNSWIYDIPLHRFPPLEKFILDKYNILNHYRPMPRRIDLDYGVGSYIYVRFKEYLVWEQNPKSSPEIDEDEFESISDDSDYFISGEVIAGTLAGDYDPSPADIARLVVMIHLAVYITERLGKDLITGMLDDVWHINIPEYLVNRFKYNAEFYDATLEIGECLRTLINRNKYITLLSVQSLTSKASSSQSSSPQLLSHNFII